MIQMFFDLILVQALWQQYVQDSRARLHNTCIMIVLLLQLLIVFDLSSWIV